jgi:cobalamin biosynthesis protein CobD/CbiB
VSKHEDRNRWVIGGSTAVLLVIAFPLYREFAVPGMAAWNLFLATFLIAVVVAAVFLLRYFSAHADEIGEARFDTRNKSDHNG